MYGCNPLARRAGLFFVTIRETYFFIVSSFVTLHTPYVLSMTWLKNHTFSKYLGSRLSGRRDVRHPRLGKTENVRRAHPLVPRPHEREAEPNEAARRRGSLREVAVSRAPRGSAAGPGFRLTGKDTNE